jgi:hypothetical protein
MPRCGGAVVALAVVALAVVALAVVALAVVALAVVAQGKALGPRPAAAALRWRRCRAPLEWRCWALLGAAEGC